MTNQEISSLSDKDLRNKMKYYRDCADDNVGEPSHRYYYDNYVLLREEFYKRHNKSKETA